MFGFFKSKRAFDEAVQKEVDKREAERKAKIQKSWDKWAEDNPVVDIHLAKKDELRVMYVKAEELYKNGAYNDALVIINQIMEGFTEIGEIIGLYVFILLIDVMKSLEGMDGATEAYDMGISYYRELSGEQADKWSEHLEIAKKSYIEEETMLADMRERYEFTLTDEIVVALKRLEGLVVFRYIGIANMSSFDVVWKEVLKQVDYYEQEEKGWNNLNKTTYKGAKNWLKSFSHLCIEDIPEEYRVKEA